MRRIAFGDPCAGLEFEKTTPARKRQVVRHDVGTSSLRIESEAVGCCVGRWRHGGDTALEPAEHAIGPLAWSPPRRLQLRYKPSWGRREIIKAATGLALRACGDTSRNAKSTNPERGRRCAVYCGHALADGHSPASEGATSGLDSQGSPIAEEHQRDETKATTSIALIHFCGAGDRRLGSGRQQAFCAALVRRNSGIALVHHRRPSSVSEPLCLCNGRMTPERFLKLITQQEGSSAARHFRATPG